MAKRKPRSFVRIVAGWLAYTILRYVQWIVKAGSWCKRSGSVETDGFDYSVFHHESLLFRNLKNTEQWMDDNKIHNLNMAILKLDGLVLMPGKTLSFWKLIGGPFGFRGFKKGVVLVNGRVEIKTGGGLCQLSNLLYWITLHSPLTVTERFRHSFDVFPDSGRTQPFGSGATCLYNYRDLQIRNNSIEPYLLRLHLDTTHLHGEWKTQKPVSFRYEVYEKKHWITQEGPFYIRNNILMRRCFRGERQISDEYVTENHALMMYSPLIDAPKSFSPGEEVV
ncbi:MAG: VanW family protein [Spirochaetales bacterium]|nr:VanW family protein [Spirochaetales bacterium]